ncbi:DMT family transporter [Pararhizobium sp. DWP3-4]|uniref:DMT family transporter n=1 Tax=Pararhizobium sp. DWP3-4 TaxID=2804565 RepID=UPI003CEF1017
MSILPNPRVIFPREPSARGTRLGILCGIIAAIIWGAFLTVSRHGIGAGLQASDLAFMRYSTAGLLLLPMLLWRSPWTLGGIGWCKGAVLALLAGPLFVLIGANGYHFAPLAHGAVIQLGMLTLMSICLAALVLGERLGLLRIVGLAVLIAGLATIAGPGLLSGGSQAWIGDILFAVAGSMFACFTILVRRWKISPVNATLAVSVLSGAVYAPIYLATEGLGRLAAASPAMVIEQVGVQGILSGVVALFAFSEAVQHLGAGRAALFPALAPVVAILLGIPLVGELPTAGQWLGLVIATAGLIVALRNPSSATPAVRPN